MLDERQRKGEIDGLLLALMKERGRGKVVQLSKLTKGRERGKVVQLSKCGKGVEKVDVKQGFPNWGHETSVGTFSQ